MGGGIGLASHHRLHQVTDKCRKYHVADKHGKRTSGENGNEKGHRNQKEETREKITTWNVTEL